MAIEQTLAIIKPDCVGKNQIGLVLSLLEKGGLKVVACKMIHLTKEKAEEFYAIHKGKHFFDTLIKFITSGPSLVMVLEGEDAILKNREIMGATDPKKAALGTIRNLYGNFTNMEENVIHGSDSVETAKMEIPFFFKSDELFRRTRN
jgi:nucleoside-diphosphate kinase